MKKFSLQNISHIVERFTEEILCHYQTIRNTIDWNKTLISFEIVSVCVILRWGWDWDWEFFYNVPNSGLCREAFGNLKLSLTVSITIKFEAGLQYTTWNLQYIDI